MEKIDYRLACIIPAFNEEISIEGTIRSVAEALPQATIFVINNASTDKTREIAQHTLKALQNDHKIIDEPNKGKGNALRTAFSKVDADIYMMIDGDETYDPASSGEMIDYILSGKADMVVGNRHHDGQYEKVNTRLFHGYGNKFVTRFINFLFKSNLKDILSGYRVFSRKFIQFYPVLSKGFEVEVEMTLHALHNRFNVIEHDVEYKNRPEGSYSKLNTYVDGLKVIKTILWVFKDYKPLSFFFFLSLVSITFAIIFGHNAFLEYINKGVMNRIPLAILSSAFVISAIIFLSIGTILHSIVKYHKINFELMLNKYDKEI